MPKNADATASTTALVRMDPQALLAHAVEHKADVGILERLVALAKDVKAAQAKEAWQQAMSDFQQDCPPIKKTAKASIQTSGGGYGYSYAPLDEILAIARPVLAKHRLTVTWRHPHAVQPGHIASVCRIAHEQGHYEESDAVELPVAGRSASDRGGANDAQRVGMALTYSKRYAFLAISGITPEAEDDDSGGASETPAAPAADGTMLIAEVREFKTKRGAGWSIVFDTGENYATFNSALAGEAREHLAAKRRVLPVTEVKGQYVNLVDLRRAEFLHETTEEAANRLFPGEDSRQGPAEVPAAAAPESTGVPQDLGGDRAVILEKIAAWKRKKAISEEMFYAICASVRVDPARLERTDPAVLTDILNKCIRYTPTTPTQQQL